MALISKEDLLTKFETGALLFQPEVKRIIKIQPEVDAVEVVRCKDCKHFAAHWNPNFPCGSCSIWGDRAMTDDYCSYGERGTDETD